MAAITPSTNLKLLKNPNNLSNQNQLTFANATAQYNYFNSLTKLEVEDFTYQRKDYVIRYKACIDDILDYNYVMYQNEAYSNKWFYAYIENMRWINDNLTEITIKTDVFQTFQFDLTYKASFVEREHVNDDTVGKHLVPEGLETGEYIVNGSDNYKFSDLVYLINVGKYNNGQDVVSTPVGGIPTAGGFYKVDSIALVRTILQAYVEETGVSLDDIFNVYIAPSAITVNNDDPTHLQWTGTDAPKYFAKTLTIPTTIDTYTPKNKKVLCYPYNYLLVTNTSGNAETFHYERFTGAPIFSISGVPTPGCSIVCVPSNYNATGAIPSMIYASKFPTLSWSGDAYTNWLTQSGVNILGTVVDPITAGYVSAGVEAAIGIASLAAGNPYGISNLAGGVGTVMQTMQAQYEHEVAPNSFYGNANNGDYINASSQNGFYFYNMTIDKNAAKRIDDFFSMYGYKVNSVKVPNRTGRTNWNYVKTIGANIEGLIPEFYLNEIKSLFDAGITLWHTTQYFLDYSRTNNIVS